MQESKMPSTTAMLCAASCIVRENIPETEDDIFSAIDRFWELDVNGVTESEPEQTDLLVMFGGYLKIVDA